MFSETLRFCLEFSGALTLLFSEALRFCLEFSGALTLLFSETLRFGSENCPPETGWTSAAEGVDITLNTKL